MQLWHSPYSLGIICFLIFSKFLCISVWLYAIVLSTVLYWHLSKSLTNYVFFYLFICINTYKHTCTTVMHDEVFCLNLFAGQWVHDSFLPVQVFRSSSNRYPWLQEQTGPLVECWQWCEQPPLLLSQLFTISISIPSQIHTSACVKNKYPLRVLILVIIII